jgi:hypothetical protein
VIHGDERVAQPVAQHHRALAEPLRARGAHEVAAEHLEHRRARDAREEGDRARAERERRQDEVADPAVARRRQPAQLHREEQDEQQPHPVHREGDAEVRAAERRRSTQPPGRRALSTPSRIPSTDAKSIAVPASSSVRGKRSAMSPVIGRLVMNERPRSPRSTPPA